MANHSIANPGPEKSKYDQVRHESMRLKANGTYGIPKFFLKGELSTCCERCVFGRGEHAADCITLTPAGDSI